MTEPFVCPICRRRIGETAPHAVIAAIGTVVCIRCVLPFSSHRTLFPRCLIPWHDLHDHGPVTLADRESARWLVDHGQLTNTERT